MTKPKTLTDKPAVPTTDEKLDVLYRAVMGLKGGHDEDLQKAFEGQVSTDTEE